MRTKTVVGAVTAESLVDVPLESRVFIKQQMFRVLGALHVILIFVSSVTSGIKKGQRAKNRSRNL